MSDILSALNEKQRMAVEYLKGPLSVFAGPGTGKTRVTTHKVAYLIEQGYDPSEILALTFTQKAAREMEERVRELVPGVRGINISTFHSFCNEIVNENALTLGVNSGRTVLTQPYQQAFLYRNMESLGLEYFDVSKDPRDLAKTFQSAITRFKQENISPERLSDYLESLAPEVERILEEPEDEITGPQSSLVGEFARLSDFLRAYVAYEEFKEEKGLIDFEDMQLLALRLLENNPVVLQSYRKKIKYVIVDEFQDTDYIQLQLIFRLADKGNITIVGDDDQSIYRFRGAYLTNVHEFRKFYTDRGMKPEEIVLDTNYRSTEDIQKIASALIENNPERVKKIVHTGKGKGAPVIMYHYDTEEDQAYHTAIKIKEMKETLGLNWGDFAILFRKRADSRRVADALGKAGLPFEVLGSRDYFGKPIIRSVFSYLSYVSDPLNHEYELAHILLRPGYGLTPLDVRLLSGLAKDRGVSMWEAMQDLSDYTGNRKGMESFVETMNSLFDALGEGGIYGLVRAILFSRDFFRVEIHRDNRENIRLLNRFLRITEEYLDLYPDSDIDSFMEHLEVMKRLGIDDEEEYGSGERIHIMTVHGAKGLEYPVIFVPALNEKHFPTNFRKKEIPIPDEISDAVKSSYGDEDQHYFEERRLLYVAATRAKDHLILSYCDIYHGNKKATPPSRYREEIKGLYEGQDISNVEPIELASDDVHERMLDHLIRSVQREEWQSALDAIAGLAMNRGASLSSLSFDRSVRVEDILSRMDSIEMEPVKYHAENSTYSPSQLKKYEECPRQYYFRYILGIPEERKTWFYLGTTVHLAVEMITRRLRDGEQVSEPEALAILDTLWSPSAYTSPAKERKDREDAERMIIDFMRRQATKSGEIIGIEEWIELDVGGKKIKGKVDRMDLVDGHIDVIDYKTSKNTLSRPKLKKDFQMGLYWAGTEELKGIPVKSTGHWYLRKDKEVMVELSPQELDEIKQRALSVIESIESGNFEPKPDYNTCRWCDFRELCDKTG